MEHKIEDYCISCGSMYSYILRHDQSETYDNDKYGSLTINDLSKYICVKCGYSFLTEESNDIVKKAISQYKKQENKMKIEQYIPKEQIEPVKKYPKWMAYIRKDGVLKFAFVNDTGELMCCLNSSGCREILEEYYYETDFAEWGEDGEFIRFKEGWY